MQLPIPVKRNGECLEFRTAFGGCLVLVLLSSSVLVCTSSRVQQEVLIRICSVHVHLLTLFSVNLSPAQKTTAGRLKTEKHICQHPSNLLFLSDYMFSAFQNMFRIGKQCSVNSFFVHHHGAAVSAAAAAAD